MFDTSAAKRVIEKYGSETDDYFDEKLKNAVSDEIIAAINKQIDDEINRGFWQITNPVKIDEEIEFIETYLATES